jgi:hypothetical protein
MKIRETFEYPAGVEAVFALISDDEFRVGAAEKTGGLNVEALVTTTGNATKVTLQRTQPATVPEFVKKFIGDAVTVKQVEAWGAPDADGTRRAKLTMKVAGQPAGFDGTATLRNAGKGAEFTVSGEVKVSVPFVGKKVEPVIAKAVISSIKHDVQAGVAKLS